MKVPSISTLSFILLLVSSCSSWPPADGHANFLSCLTIPNNIYVAANSSYTPVLQSSIPNLRFASEATPKPQVIVAPEHESQIPPIIFCAKRNDLEIRTRSGGHDFEGLSFVSRVPFVIIDLINLSEITVDAKEKIAWVGAGATLGSLYYRIAEKSSVLGFPGGFAHTVGVGGHFSGGGYGTMFRKFGLAADHVIDARIVDVNGKILDRKSMGEDLFWAIRGGGGASFGVIVAWKVQLVDVPEIVTVFTVHRSLEQNGSYLVDRWQHVAPEIDRNLFIKLLLYKGISTTHASFYSFFLGGAEELLQVLQESFPELGVVREDCSEMSWIQSALHFSKVTGSTASFDQPEPIETLLKRAPSNQRNMKVKTDYVKKPIPEHGLQGMIKLLDEAKGHGTVVIYMVPYGGRMAEISESATPFPHRAGNLYMLACFVIWEDKVEDSDKFISWSRRYYRYLAPYVSRSPREAYLDYRDLDIGVNNVEGDTSYEQASIWGRKYFKNNFDRLVQVKTMVDPDNFFKNEQSIPPLHFM